MTDLALPPVTALPVAEPAVPPRWSRARSDCCWRRRVSTAARCPRAGGDPRARRRLRRPLFPARALRGLEPRGGHREVGHLQHRPRRRRARGRRRQAGFAYSDDISLAALDEAAQAVRAIGRQGQSAVAPTRPAQRPPMRCIRTPIRWRAWPSERRWRCSSGSSGLRARCDPRVTQVMASLAGEHETILIARSDGLRGRRRASAGAGVDHRDRGGERPSRAGLFGRRRTLRLRVLHRRDALAVTRSEAVDQALLNLSARDAPAGNMTVVLGNGWPGILLHEAIGHGLEGDFNRKGTSAFSGRVGQRVACQGRHRGRRRHARSIAAARSTSTTKAILRSARC